HPNAPGQDAARREWQALSKGRNEGLAHWGGSLRAGLEGAIRHVMPLAKDRPFPSRHALRLAPSRPAEWYRIYDEVH
ncbi:MAG: hypothetical protein KZQ86_21300, partial [Candidatus Thiodiazotropha sp. (ex Lucinoma kastoroae)]|nr:hypothetical protein [Candidatus Thiodiazotropha sp. (ex Lucinoma kastoroae)]